MTDTWVQSGAAVGGGGLVAVAVGGFCVAVGYTLVGGCPVAVASLVGEGFVVAVGITLVGGFVGLGGTPFVAVGGTPVGGTPFVAVGGTLVGGLVGLGGTTFVAVGGTDGMGVG